MKRQGGFSLVELMIVVAIMAILAAIAIPSFMRFSMRAKTAEATSNLAAIRTAEESYRAENDTYATCTASPAVMSGAGASTPRAWNDTGAAPNNFTTIGFSPDGNVRYSYRVIPGTVSGQISVSFCAIAEGDLDEDTQTALFTVDKDVGTYPKAVKTGDDF